MEDLKAKTALVTGASTGIGAAVAIAFAARGMRVAVHYNSSADAATRVVDTIRAAGGTAFALQADVRDTAAIRACVQEITAQFGRIADGDASVEDVGWEMFRLMLEVASGRQKTWAEQWKLHNALVLFNPAPVT